MFKSSPTIMPLSSSGAVRNVKSAPYNAKGDGKLLNDCSISAGSNLANSASANFTTADIGKIMEINRAGPSSAPFRATITGINSPTQAVLSASATTTVNVTASIALSQVDESRTYYGTDDTAAFQSAISDALLQANTAGGGSVEIYAPNGIYIFNGALQDTSISNAQLYLPTIPGYSGPQIKNKVSISIVGENPPNMAYNDAGSDALTPAYGTVFKSTLNAGAGGAFFRAKTSSADGYFHRAHVVMKNITVRMPENPVLTAVDLSNSVTCDLQDVNIDAGNYKVPSIPNWTTSSSFGLKLPTLGNGASTACRNVGVIGFYNGIQDGEHAVGNITIWTCKNAVYVKAMYLPSAWSRVAVTACVYTIVADPAMNGADLYNRAFVHIKHLFIEHHQSSIEPIWPVHQNAINDVSDTVNAIHGKIEYFASNAKVGWDHSFVKSGGTNLVCTELAP